MRADLESAISFAAGQLVAVIYAGIGERERALRSDPRFLELKRRVGL